MLIRRRASAERTIGGQHLDLFFYSHAFAVQIVGNRAGEGWFLTADMIDLLYHECRGVVCLQPFACLPNHITGEGMVHKLHAAYPEAVFLALDCDASASEVNQENRLKLMMNALTEKTKAPKEMSFIQKTMNLRKGTTL